MTTALPSELDVGRRSAPNPAGPVRLEAPGTQGYDIVAQNYGKTANSMGVVADELYKAQDDYATVSASNALNQLAEKFELAQNNPENTGWRQKGRQIAAGPDFFGQTTEQLGGLHKSVADTISDPLVKRKFEQKAQGMMMMQKAKVLEHQALERNKWDEEVREATFSRSLRTVNSLDMSSPTFASSYKMAVAEAESAYAVYMRNRVSQDKEGLQAITEVTQNVRDQFGEALLNKAIMADRPDIARQLWDGTHSSGLEALSKTLSPQVVQKMHERVKSAVADGKATATVDEAWNEFGPKPDANGAYNYNAPLPMFQMEEKIRVALANDPASRDKAISSLRSRAQGFNAQQTELRNGNIGAVDTQLYIDKVPLAQVMKTQAWKLLSGIDQATVAKGFQAYQATEESRAYTRENRALTAENRAALRDQKVTPDQLAIFDRLVGIRFNDPAKFASMTVADMTAAGLKNPGLIHQVITAKTGVLKKDENEAEKQVRITSAMNEVKSMTDAIPGLSAKARGTSAQARERYDTFTGMFDRAITDWRNLNGGKNPSSEELRKIAAPLLAEVEVPGSWWGTNAKRAFDVMPGEQVVGFTIPKKAQASLSMQFEEKFKRKPNMSDPQDKAFIEGAYRLGLENGFDWSSDLTRRVTGK